MKTVILIVLMAALTGCASLTLGPNGELTVKAQLPGEAGVGE